MNDLKLHEYYKQKELIDTFIAIDSEINKLSSPNNVYLHRGYWHQGGRDLIKEAWDKKTYDYVLWPIRAGYNKASVLVVISIKEKKAIIHSPDLSEVATQQKKDLLEDLKHLQGLEEKNILLDASNSPSNAWQADADYICVLYIINALKQIKEGKYTDKINNAKWRNGQPEFEAIKKRFNELSERLKLLPTLSQLDNTDKMIADLNQHISEKEQKIAQLVVVIKQLIEEIAILSVSVGKDKSTTNVPASNEPKSLSNPADGGFTEEKLKEILENKKNQYEFKFDSVLTAETLDKLLNKAKKAVGIKPTDELIDHDLDDTLTGKINIGTAEKPIYIKGYRIEDESAIKIKVEGKEEIWAGADIEAKENEWQESNSDEDKAKQGKLKLPFFYAKNNFDPDNLTEESFCAFAIVEGEKDLKATSEGITQGALAIGTGVGKTTKTVACLCEGGKQNIVLITPTLDLAISAYNNHSNSKFLQDPNYKCVYHGKVHGIYETELNNLTQWKNRTSGRTSGKAGVSVLYYPYLIGYMARELLNVDKIKIVDVGRGVNLVQEQERLNKNLENAKKKTIPDDTIFIFDEAHFTKTPAYQQLFKELVYLESVTDKTKPAKKVILMSATFRNKPFSITTSFPIESREVNRFSQNTQFTDERYKDFNEKLANSQTILFADNPSDTLNLTAIKKVPYVTFNEANSEFVEGISGGIPKGGLMIANSNFRMGFNLICQIVVDTAREEIEDIKAGWRRETKEKEYSEADMTQGRGRGGRYEKGWYYTLSMKIKEARDKENLLSAMVQAVFGDTTNLQKTFFDKYNKTKLAEVIKAAFAFDGENDKWGREPEALLIGLIPNITGTNCFPKWLSDEEKRKDRMKDTYDKVLWEKYLGTYEPPKLEAKQAEQTLFLMLDTKLGQQDLSKEFVLDLKSPLIKQAELKLNDEESNTKIKTVLNRVVEKQLEDLDGYEENRMTYKDQEEFNKIIGLYKMLDQVKINVEEVKNRDGEIDKNWAVKINYIAAAA